MARNMDEMARNMDEMARNMDDLRETSNLSASSIRLPGRALFIAVHTVLVLVA